LHNHTIIKKPFNGHRRQVEDSCLWQISVDVNNDKNLISNWPVRKHDLCNIVFEPPFNDWTVLVIMIVIATLSVVWNTILRVRSFEIFAMNHFGETTRPNPFIFELFIKHIKFDRNNNDIRIRSRLTPALTSPV